MAGTLKQEYTDTADGFVEIFHSTTNDRYGAQSFTTEDAYTIAGFAMRMYNPTVGDPQTLVMYLTAADGNERPTGPVLATANVDASGLIFDPQTQWLQCDFTTPYDLEAATQYCLCVGCIEDTPTSVLRLPGKVSGGAYPNGENAFSWDGGATWTTHTGVGDHFFRTYSTESEPSTPTLDYPTDNLTDVYLNSDGLLEMRWSDTDDEDISKYTVYFGFKNGTLVPQNDRTRYSITSLKMFLGEQLEYDTEYEWGVLKSIGGEDYYSDLFEFRTVALTPPGPTGTPINGLNGITTIKRLVAAANDKIWYET